MMDPVENAMRAMVEANDRFTRMWGLYLVDGGLGVTPGWCKLDLQGSLGTNSLEHLLAVNDRLSELFPTAKYERRPLCEGPTADIGKNPERIKMTVEDMERFGFRPLAIPYVLEPGLPASFEDPSGVEKLYDDDDESYLSYPDSELDDDAYDLFATHPVVTKYVTMRAETTREKDRKRWENALAVAWDDHAMLNYRIQCSCQAALVRGRQDDR